MRKIISIIFGFLFLFQVLLFSGTVTEVIVTRKKVLDNAKKFLKLEDWTPKVHEDSVPYHSFTSVYRSSMDNSLVEYTPNFTKISANNERNISVKPPYDIMPYVMGGYDTPEIVEKATTYETENPGVKVVKDTIQLETGSWVDKKQFPTCPGGANTSAYMGSSAHCARKKRLAGVDCVGFVMRSWGMPYTLSSTGHSISKFSILIPTDKWDNLQMGDYFVKPKHLRLFVRANNSQYITYESAVDQEVFGLGRYPGVFAWAYPKLNTPGDTTWNQYYARTPFPYFKYIPNKENGPTEFTLTVQAGAILKDCILKREGEQNGVNLSSLSKEIIESPVPVYGGSWKHKQIKKEIVIEDSHWKDVVGSGGKLKSVTYTLSAKNEFYHVPTAHQTPAGVEIEYTKPSANSYLYSFRDTTNFTFYKYAGTLPPAVRAVVIVNEANIIVGKYQFVRKSDGSYQHVADNVLPFGSSTEKYTFYVAFDKKANGAKIYTGSFNRKSDDKWFDRVGTSGATPVYRRDTLNLVDSNPEAYIQDCAETGLFWI